jgi:uncharacterized protein
MTEAVPAPHFRDLTRGECESLLASHKVGRLAFVSARRIEIIPIHYVYAGGVLCGRTARGTRLEEASDNFYGSWPVAFEIDEIEKVFRWRSVVVHGNLHAAVEGGVAWQRDPKIWQDAVRSFRTLIPEAFTEKDPTPFRDVVIRIDPLEVSGRQAVS